MSLPFKRNTLTANMAMVLVAAGYASFVQLSTIVKPEQSQVLLHVQCTSCWTKSCYQFASQADDLSQQATSKAIYCVCHVHVIMATLSW